MADIFDTELADIQLEFARMTVDAVRERAAQIRAENQTLRPQGWIDFSVIVWVTLHCSPLLTYWQAEDRFEAWCLGASVAVMQVRREVIETLAARE
jgi:hypothetical protein